jgi:hexosaminidase
MRYILLYLTILIAFLNSNKSVGQNENLSSEIKLKWELITNTTNDKGEDIFKARFIIENHGDKIFKNNWKLFFSTNPRRIFPAATDNGYVEHVNGDWYQLVPSDKLTLEPDKTLEILYSGNWCLIKEGDGPLGAYFVFYDDKGNEQKIERINCEILPFTRSDQMNRSKEDFVPIPTAEYRYHKNKNVHLLSERQLLPMIPAPVDIKYYSDNTIVSNKWSIYCDDHLTNEARLLSEKIKEYTGLTMDISDSRKPEHQIVLLTKNIEVSHKKHEVYHLDITKENILITGGDTAGVFYGTQSLLALIPLESFKKRSEKIEFKQLSIKDAPRFEFRGIHTDIARNFQNKETILRELEIMSFYKLNKFYLYFSEDEGWRLEIPGLPELTEIGGKRKHTKSYHDPVLHPAYGSGPFINQKGTYGYGYLTREDFIEILKYADKRHIEVITGINMPGHSRASIKAMEMRYNRLMAKGKEKEANEYRLIDPDDRSVYISAQSYKDNVVSVARESTYRFFKKVIKEIALMYQEAGLKMKNVHVGGDEVARGAWTASPMATKLLKDLPEYNEYKDLQIYFEKRLLAIAEKMGFNLNGWEEIVLISKPKGKYDINYDFKGKDVTPYIWNNLYEYGNMDLAYRLANAGFKEVLCPATNFYFDLAYNKDPKEEGAYWAGFTNTRQAWTFAPFDLYKTTRTSYGKKLEENDFTGLERLRPEARKNIIGLEAQLWGEVIRGRDVLEYRMLPRIIAFTERAWAVERPWETIENKAEREKVLDKEWNIFANTLAQKEMPRLSFIDGGFNYRIPLPGAIVSEGKLYANIEFPGLEIRYTTDGSEPDVNSVLYDKPVSVSGEVRLKAFDSSGKGSRTVVVNAD